LVGVVAASLGIDSNGRAIWTGEAHHRDGKRFDMRAEKKLNLASVEKAETAHHGAIALRPPTGYSA